MTTVTRKMIFTGWNFMRWLRLGMGSLIIVQGFETKDAFIGMIGAFFLFQAVSGTGCCGMNGCTIPADGEPGIKKEGTASREK